MDALSQTETEPSQLKNFPKKRKSVLSRISAWVEKHKEVNFVSCNWSFNEKRCVVTCGQCKSDIGISVNEESGQWRISNVTRHILVIIRKTVYYCYHGVSAFSYFYSFRHYIRK